MADATRKVLVNVNRGGKVHELTCRWLAGAFASKLDHTSYQVMAANDKRAAGKRHCSKC